MKNPNGDKLRSERLLDGLVKELQSMTDTDALEGENPEELVKLGERLLLNARAEAGKLRMADAKRRLAVVSENETSAVLPSAAEARKYLQSLPDLTLAARNLNELSDADVLDLFSQATSLQDSSESKGD
jgi:hypothetical protein